MEGVDLESLGFRGPTHYSPREKPMPERRHNVGSEDSNHTTREPPIDVMREPIHHSLGALSH